MVKKKVYLIVVFIFLLAFLAANFSYPYFWSQRIGFPRFPEVPFQLGLDLQGGVHLLYQADLSRIPEGERTEAMAGLRDVITRRVDLFGVKEPVVQVQGDRLIVELAGVIDPAEAVRQIGKTPFLEFKEQRTEEETERILAKQREIEEKGWEEIKKIIEEGIEDWHLIFEDPFFKPTPLTGRYLKRAELGFDPTTHRPLVLLQFDSEGAKIFEELTARNIGRILAIYIDGVSISLPMVQEKISGGRAQITGQFTVEEARELARNLNAGALPVPLTLISQQWVGPILGKISVEQSLRAGLFGFLAIFIFMILFYRLPGLLASLSLLIYVFLLLSAFKLIPVTLTLAGIAGFILSIGLAIDANVLIFSRIREELKGGKSFAQAVEEGFARAWPAVRDGNLTTLIVAAILFGFGTGFVKGFAITLSLGILLSMFTAILVTKNFLRCFVDTRLEKVKSLW